MAALSAVLAAALLAGWIFFAERGDYRVLAQFQNASALVAGNEVQVSGLSIGKVESIELTSAGSAQVVLRIDDPDYSPLRRGTQAIIRQAGLAGVANRYVDLRLPDGDALPIPDGGRIEASETLSAVELDQILNTLDRPTRRALSGVIHGSAAAIDGRSEDARLAMLYLNPALAASSRLLAELNREDVPFGRFLVSSAQLANSVAARRDDLAGLIDGFADAAAAVGDRKTELAEAVGALPSTMRRANTTFVNLRGTLDDIDPLVADARPVARDLQPLLTELRGLARQARPTLADLSTVVRKAGRDNDLLEAARRLPTFRDASTREVEANGKRRAPAFTSLTKTLQGLEPIVAFARPYSVDVTGWFDDYAHSGYYDALGGAGRTPSNFSAFAQTGATLTYVPSELRDAAFKQVASRRQINRCPGSMERGTAWKPTPDFSCDLSQVPPGP